MSRWLRASIFLNAALFLFTSILLWQNYDLRQHPTVLSVKPLSSDLEAPINITKLEKLSFVRQFVEKYTTFESQSFWQGQVALSYLMGESLRDARLIEISRIKEKILKNNVSQKGQIQSIKTKELQYLVEVDILVSQNKVQNHVSSFFKIALSEVPRTLENPWGLVISALSIELKDPKITNSYEKESHYLIGVSSPLVVQFPCAVENIEMSGESPLKVKITTLNISEIQIYSEKEFATTVPIKANCHDKYFAFDFSFSKNESMVYQLLSMEQSHVRKVVESKTAKVKAKSEYHKTIEDELGFVIEE